MKRIIIITIMLILSGCTKSTSTQEVTSLLEKKDEIIHNNIEQLNAKDDLIESKECIITAKENQIMELEDYIEVLESDNEKLRNTNFEKDKLINNLNMEKENLSTNFAESDSAELYSKYQKISKSLDADNIYEITDSSLYKLVFVKNEKDILETRIYRSNMLSDTYSKPIYISEKITDYKVSSNDEFIAILYDERMLGINSRIEIIDNNGNIVYAFTLGDIWFSKYDFNNNMFICLYGFSLENQMFWGYVADGLSGGPRFTVNMESGELKLYQDFDEMNEVLERYPYIE